MSEEGDELDKIDDELFYQLVEYRTRFYENLARDALTLLSIQLFIIPISISIFSLLIQVMSEGNNSSTSPVTMIVKNVDYSLLRPAIMVGVATILFTLFIFHFSRRQASLQPNFLLQRHLPDALNDNSPFKRARKKSLAVVGKAVNVDPKDYYSQKQYDDMIKESFDNSDEALWRASFTVALGATLGSTGLLLISFIKSVYLPITNVSIFFMKNAMILLSYSLVPAFLVIILEGVLRSLGPSTAFSFAVIGSILQKGIQGIRRAVVNQSLPAILLTFYLISVGSSTFVLAEGPSMLKSGVIIGGISLGLAGLILLLVRRVRGFQ